MFRFSFVSIIIKRNKLKDYPKIGLLHLRLLDITILQLNDGPHDPVMKNFQLRSGLVKMVRDVIIGKQSCIVLLDEEESRWYMDSLLIRSYKLEVIFTKLVINGTLYVKYFIKLVHR